MKTDDYKQRVMNSATLQPTKAKKTFAFKKIGESCEKFWDFRVLREIAKTFVRRLTPEKKRLYA
jgi:hypothetical protein